MSRRTCTRRAASLPCHPESQSAQKKDEEEGVRGAAAHVSHVRVASAVSHTSHTMKNAAFEAVVAGVTLADDVAGAADGDGDGAPPLLSALAVAAAAAAAARMESATPMTCCSTTLAKLGSGFEAAVGGLVAGLEGGDAATDKGDEGLLLVRGGAGASVSVSWDSALTTTNGLVAVVDSTSEAVAVAVEVVAAVCAAG